MNKTYDMASHTGLHLSPHLIIRNVDDHCTSISHKSWSSQTNCSLESSKNASCCKDEAQIYQKCWAFLMSKGRGKGHLQFWSELKVKLSDFVHEGFCIINIGKCDFNHFNYGLTFQIDYMRKASMKIINLWIKVIRPLYLIWCVILLKGIPYVFSSRSRLSIIVSLMDALSNVTQPICRYSKHSISRNSRGRNYGKIRPWLLFQLIVRPWRKLMQGGHHYDNLQCGGKQ